jgi:hypothetical protein
MRVGVIRLASQRPSRSFESRPTLCIRESTSRATVRLTPKCSARRSSVMRSERYSTCVHKSCSTAAYTRSQRGTGDNLVSSRVARRPDSRWAACPATTYPRPTSRRRSLSTHSACSAWRAGDRLTPNARATCTSSSFSPGRTRPSRIICCNRRYARRCIDPAPGSVAEGAATAARTSRFIEGSGLQVVRGCLRCCGTGLSNNVAACTHRP